MVNWAELNDNYGSADAVPHLLAAAESETSWEAAPWQDLWSRLYHQGTVSAAGLAALPALCAIARCHRPVALDPALFLAASIISSTDGPPEQMQARVTYAADLIGLAPVALEKLGLVTSPTDFIWALQAVAAIEDLSVWQRHLESLANEEAELDCPHCGDHIYIELDSGTWFATPDPDDVSDGTPLRPAVEGELDEAEERLQSLAQDHGRTGIAAQLLQLFGHATCPVCDTAFRTRSAFA